MTVRLQQQWSPEQRTWFHHASQGTSTFDIPYEWFIALEQPHGLGTSAGLLSDPAYLERVGFLPSERHTEYNPDNLPIGFARGGESVDAVLEALARGLTHKMLHGTLAELHSTEGAEREQLARTVSRLFLRQSTRIPGGESR